MIDVRLIGVDGNRIHISPAGEIAVSPREPSIPTTIKLDTINTAYNFITPSPGVELIITDIVLTADKNVNTDTLIHIYEADSASSTVVLKQIFQTELLKNSSMSLTGLVWKVNQGRYLNAKTDDDDVFCTIAYRHQSGHRRILGLNEGEDA